MRVEHSRYGAITLPDFLIAGTAKSATTSLYRYLNQHPQINMSSMKESWFFSFVDNPPKFDSPGKLNVVSDLASYVRLFADAGPGQCLGDASPSYLYTHRESIRNIKAVYPAAALDELRIIIVLRNPIHRAFSQYWGFKRRNHEPLSFDEAIDDETTAERMRSNWNIFYDYVGFGRYYAQVSAFIDAFGRDRVLILLYEDIQREPIASCQRIFEFMDVDAGFVPDVTMRYNNVSGAPRLKWIVPMVRSQNPLKRRIAAPVKRALGLLPQGAKPLFFAGLDRFLFKRTEMSGESRRKLARAYADDIQQLERLIGRDLAHWRECD